jgi:hypothetical protein
MDAVLRARSVAHRRDRRCERQTTHVGNLEQQPLGFTPANRLVTFIEPPATLAGDAPRLTDLYARFGENLRQVPGVERGAFSMYSPMEGNNWSSGISIGGPDARSGQFHVRLVESCHAGLLRDGRHARDPRTRDRRARHADDQAGRSRQRSARSPLAQTLGTQLYGVGELDPKVFVGATLALIVSAILAAARPTRRAASVNPAIALRSE